ncbi:DgyrCDS14683 [Dimorphilus gyrociliatus]|uniref:DgyrCDS14683 n=1 Tax=Dimorphilus gyrociliatus TaxID=2664684 RepID=A0A7I8WEQ7_9ANNE|nr:DgyrCDS14683 [Dimorphilus gyrociliatus]
MFLLLFLFSSLFMYGSSFLADGKLVNVCRQKFGATCQASSSHADLRDYTFICTNALEPHWINYRDWASQCVSNCNNQNIRITFASISDIAEICIDQRLHSPPHLVKEVKLDFSNGASFTVQLDQVNFQKCFLLPNATGENSQWITATTQKDFGSGQLGLGSIMAYVYKDLEGEEEKHLTNIAGINKGSTCTASHSPSTCTKALDYDFAPNLKADWITSCVIVQCTNIIYKLFLKDGIAPKMLCIAPREYGENTILKTVKIEWSSGLIQMLIFPNSRLRQCFDYEGYSIESSINATIIDTYSQAPYNLGFAYFQLYTIETPLKNFDIIGNLTLFYYIPSYLYKTFYGFTFGINAQNSLENSISISYWNKDKELFTIHIDHKNGNDRDTILEIDDSTAHKITTKIADDHLLAHNVWREFWITIKSNRLEFGRGIVYGKNRLLSSFYLSNPLCITRVGIKNKETTGKVLFGVYDLLGQMFKFPASIQCLSLNLVNLYDSKPTTCINLREDFHTIEKVFMNGIFKRKYDKEAHAVLRYQNEDEKFIKVYYIITEKDLKVSKVCPLKTIGKSLNNINKYWFDCNEKLETIHKITIKIILSEKVDSLEICKIYP